MGEHIGRWGGGRTETLHLCGLLLVTKSLTRMMGWQVIVWPGPPKPLYHRGIGREVERTMRETTCEFGDPSSPNPMYSNAMGTLGGSNVNTEYQMTFPIDVLFLLLVHRAAC